MFEGIAPIPAPTRTHRDRRPGVPPLGVSAVFVPFGPRATRAMLAGMALLVLLMPMNYRAGTATDHPHAFFQEAIDLLTGSPHEHGEDPAAAIGHAHDSHHHAAPRTGSAEAVATVSPFLAADIPLAAAAQAAAQAATLPAPSTGAAADPATTTATTTTTTTTWQAGRATAIPAGLSAAHGGRDAGAASSSPDLPSVTSLTPAAEKASAILILTTALATMLLAASRRRTLCDAVDRLTAIVRPVDAPPPRVVPG